MPSGIRDIFITDVMLATGGSAVEAVNLVKASDNEDRSLDIRFLCILAAPEGIAKLRQAHPDVRIYVCKIDRELNDKGYILPGLGDAGDRLSGTR